MDTEPLLHVHLARRHSRHSRLHLVLERSDAQLAQQDGARGSDPLASLSRADPMIREVTVVYDGWVTVVDSASFLFIFCVMFHMDQ